jgi:hypothetical protein
MPECVTYTDAKQSITLVVNTKHMHAQVTAPAFLVCKLAHVRVCLVQVEKCGQRCLFLLSVCSDVFDRFVGIKSRMVFVPGTPQHTAYP